MLAGEVKDVVLLDVTPLSLGVETLGGIMTALIQRNTTIPTKKKEIFTTASDNQTQVEIHVLQGERQMARDNRTLGRFHLIGIPPASRGIPQVEVAFDIDANGILNVAAKDLATNKEQKITITSTSGLAKDEVEKMVKEAEGHAEEDIKRKELVETRNQLDSLIYSTEKLLTENRAKIPDSDAREVEEAVAEAKKALDKDDTGALKEAINRINTASHKIAEAMYKTATAGQGSPQAGGEKQGDVVEAEVVDEKQ